MEGQYTSINDMNMPLSISGMNTYETRNVIMDLNFVEENLGRDWWHQDKEETKHSLRKERNKIAARKCRQKKLDKLNNLGRKLSNLKEDIEAAEQSFHVGAANEEDMILIKAANEAKMKTKKE